jgi:hypothetical protein
MSAPAPAAASASPPTSSPAASPPSSTPTSPAAPSVSARPDWAPEAFWDATKGELKGADLRKTFDDLTAFKAAADSKQLSVPKPNEYKLEFAKDYVLPQGTEWKWDENSPLLTQVREFASASGMNQDTFSKLLGLHAASRINEDQSFATAKAAEVAKLGENANARVDSVKTWLKAMGGEHFNDLARVLDMAPTASTVRGLETLMQRYVSQGGASFNGAHREPIIPGKLSDAEYGKLTYAERIDYAAKFPQPGR